MLKKIASFVLIDDYHVDDDDEVVWTLVRGIAQLHWRNEEWLVWGSCGMSEASTVYNEWGVAFGSSVLRVNNW